MFSLQRRCSGCRVPFSDPRCFLPVTVYGTTHPHLVHMCWPLLWGLEIPLQSPPPRGQTVTWRPCPSPGGETVTRCGGGDFKGGGQGMCHVQRGPFANTATLCFCIFPKCGVFVQGGGGAWGQLQTAPLTHWRQVHLTPPCDPAPHHNRSSLMSDQRTFRQQGACVPAPG